MTTTEGTLLCPVSGHPIDTKGNKPKAFAGLLNGARAKSIVNGLLMPETHPAHLIAKDRLYNSSIGDARGWHDPAAAWAVVALCKERGIKKVRNPAPLFLEVQMEASMAGPPESDLLYPLDLVYLRAGIRAPSVEVVQPDDIPLPYRALLVHDVDMTLTLERHFGGRVALRPLSTFIDGGSYFRRVLLVQEYAGQPVEMGAIRMRLDAFPDEIRRRILENEAPLGRILRDGRFEYESRVQAFLAVTPNPEMMGVFWMREPRVLYGRRTEVLRGGAKIGDIVEVLPLVLR